MVFMYSTFHCKNNQLLMLGLFQNTWLKFVYEDISLFGLAKMIPKGEGEINICLRLSLVELQSFLSFPGGIQLAKPLKWILLFSLSFPPPS